jgi:hypothetical protein
MRKGLPLLCVAFLGLSGAVGLAGQSGDEIRTARLMKRRVVNGVDNYAYATYSFRYGGNGPDIQQQCKNNWEIIFGNSPVADAFDVSLVTDDRSRIKDLGKLAWSDTFQVPALSAYEEPEREPAVKAVEGHIYLVRARDTETDLYVLFRVEKLTPGESVDIGWKVISPPRRR